MALTYLYLIVAIIFEVFATTALKKDDGVRPGTTAPRQIRRLGVVGSGFMGAGIAGTAVLNVEVDTRLKDSDLTRVGKGLKAATGLLKERLERRRHRLFEHDLRTLRRSRLSQRNQRFERMLRFRVRDVHVSARVESKHRSADPGGRNQRDPQPNSRSSVHSHQPLPAEDRRRRGVQHRQRMARAQGLEGEPGRRPLGEPQGHAEVERQDDLSGRDARPRARRARRCR